MDWYEIVGYKGHQGSGRYKEVFVYIYSKDIISARKRYFGLPAIKSWQPARISTVPKTLVEIIEQDSRTHRNARYGKYLISEEKLSEPPQHKESCF